MLIEMNARLHGRLDPGLMIKVAGASQPELVVKCLLDEHAFASIPEGFSSHRGRAMKVYLIAPRAGTLERDVDLAPLQALPSFQSMVSKLQAGARVQKTESLTTVAGIVYLFHPSAEQLRADCELIRAAEEGILYEGLRGNP